MITSKPQQNSSLFPDLTPLLDLVFIVMVFLLLTANVEIKTMDVHIPQTEESDILSSPKKDIITVNILARESSWAIQGTPYSDWKLFTKELLTTVENSPQKTLVIAADKSASIEAMLKLLAFLQKNQINATNIMMEDTQS